MGKTMKHFYFLIFVILTGCALKPPTHIQTISLDKYQYMLIEKSAGITSIQASNGYASSRDVNPGSLIEGLLLKRGLIKVPSASPQTSGKLLLVNYGISGKRNIAGGLGGYAQEMTISLVDAERLSLVYSCTAEGIGSTEADDIREAIMNCMRGLK